MIKDNICFLRLIGVAVLAAFVTFAHYAPVNARPLAALFDILPADGADKGSADEATRTIRLALRDNGRVDVLQIRPDAPSVRRAVAEGTLKEEDVSKVATPEVRHKLATAIGARYALGGGLSFKDGQVVIAAELLDVAENKKWQKATTVTIPEPSDTRSIANAVESAASTLAADLSNEAFGAIPQTVTPPAAAPDRLTEAGRVVEDSHPDKRAERAQAHMQSGNVSAAIYELRRAIQSDPKNPLLRVALADAYTRRGLVDMAQRELNRAIELGSTDEQVLQSISALYEAKGTPQEMIPIYEKLIKDKPEDVALRLSLGDLLWRRARVDDAIRVYTGAAALDAKNIDVHDRLARSHAAKSQFDESLKHLKEITKLEDPPNVNAVASRYTALMAVVEAEIKSISNQFDQGAKAFESQLHTREQYYELIRSLSNRADTLTHFIDRIAAPANTASAHSHRILACSLLSQAGMSLMSYLETNNQERQVESQLYLKEAQKELTLAAAR